MAVSKKKKVVAEMNQEQLYQASGLNLEIVNIMTDMELKFKSYKRAIELLTKITTDYQEDVLLYPGETARDGRELTEEEKTLLAVPAARERLEKIQKEYDSLVSKFLDKDFQDAMKKYESASSAAEFEEVIKQLENNKRMKKTYLPARSTVKLKLWSKIREEQKTIPDTIKSCKEKIEVFERKAKKKQKTLIALVAVAIVAILFTFTTPLPKLVKANAEAALGFTGKAWDDYKELDQTYGKPEYHEKYLEFTCKKGEKFLQEGDYKKAYDTVNVAAKEGYQGAEELLYKIEMESILNRKIGGSAHFGSRIWHIIERTETEAVLMTRASVSTDVVFSEKEADWEGSDLRAYLNSEFFENTFTDIEKADILLTKVSSDGNPEYQIPAGEATEDHVYILSAEEVTKYGKFTKKLKKPYWLRTPGAEKGTTAFAIKDNPKTYGYLSNDSSMTVYPVIRITLENYK
ncbi:MAG: DUF6273 domain-containing protein [Dorea sp.]|nr:DUF6273 domain-containing protein [Dorea sp.]